MSQTPQADPSRGSNRLLDGFRLLKGNPVLLSTTVMFMSANLGLGKAFVWLPIYSDETLGGGSALVALIQHTWAAALGLTLLGLFSAPLTIWAQTLRMDIIPAELRGRAFALLRMLMQSANPLGGLLAGPLLPLVGIQAGLAT
ncbi:MAG TPA: hypothetical protein VGA07_09435 [Anaerolineales bacterium]